MSEEGGIYVVFDEPRKAGDRRPPVEHRYGPYLAAEVVGDTLTVIDLQAPGGDMLVALARLGPNGWEVDDGMGADMPPYKGVRFVAADSKALVEGFAEGGENN